VNELESGQETELLAGPAAEFRAGPTVASPIVVAGAQRALALCRGQRSLQRIGPIMPTALFQRRRVSDHALTSAATTSIDLAK